MRGLLHRCAVARAVVLAGLAACVIACGDRAETPTVATKSMGGPGQVLYLTYCQSCHGAAGRGDGPAAASLRTPPTDLTQLWRTHGTPLDRQRVAGYIDGRGLVDVHGPREMPIWGEEFFEDVPETTPSVEQVKRRLIDVLVEYLERLQTERRT